MKCVLAVAVEANDKTAVYLDAVLMENPNASGIILHPGVRLRASARFWSVSDSNPMNTPVQPARAMSRTNAGSSVTSSVTAALQIFCNGRNARQSSRK